MKLALLIASTALLTTLIGAGYLRSTDTDTPLRPEWQETVASAPVAPRDVQAGLRGHRVLGVGLGRTEGRWEQYRPMALKTIRGAAAFIGADGLEHVSPEEGRAICRKALESSLSRLGASPSNTARRGAIEGQRENLLLEKALSSGKFEGYSTEVLDTIRAAYRPSLETAADDYVAALDGAIRELWKTNRELSWHQDDPDPGYGDREGKPTYTMVSQMGPWCFRVVVWRDDHPDLLQAHEHLKTLRRAVLQDQIDYLRSL